MDKYLMINRLSDFGRGLMVGLKPEGQGLTLKDAGGIARGCIYLPQLDSGRRDFLWTRLNAEITPFEGYVRISAFATDADVMPGQPCTVQEYMNDLYTPLNIKLNQLDVLYTASFVGGKDVLLQLRGRYLYVKIELVVTGEEIPVLHSVRAKLSGDHMLDYLPAVYQRSDSDGFLFRYLSLYDSMIKDMEEKIEHFDEKLDFDKQTGEILQYLAGWIGVDEADMDDETLRKVMRTAVTDYERAQTPEGIKDLAERLTGVRPILIEHFQVEQMQKKGADTALYEKLFGTQDNRFHILLPEGCFEDRQAAQDFMKRIERDLPANVQAELVLLKNSVYLDRHSYLGVNSAISGHTDAAIHRKAAIVYDTVIGGKLE